MKRRNTMTAVAIVAALGSGGLVPAAIAQTIDPPASIGGPGPGGPVGTPKPLERAPSATDDVMRDVAPTSREVIGRGVVNKDGEDVGEIADIVTEKSSNDLYAVLSVGGFLGIGEKNVAIPLRLLQFGGNDVILMSQDTEETLKGMPAYDQARYQPLSKAAPGAGPAGAAPPGAY